MRPAPARIVAGGLPSEALLAHVLVSKYGDSLPLYRQCQILDCGGIHLDRATLCDWVRQACWWLRPLHELVLAHVVGHARGYGLRHWEGLCRFLDDGALELDTNSVEREIRPVVVTQRMVRGEVRATELAALLPWTWRRPGTAASAA
jgi:hypothetical protein